MVATIAQIFLHPAAADKLCTVLPDYAKCHLAPVATWADNIRYRMRWSAPLHYVNGVGDHPSQRCVFGEEGWQGRPGVNVLAGIENTTRWIEEGYAGEEEALKFLVHWMGDMHQPLHMSGREKGGNGAKVAWNGRSTSKYCFAFRGRSCVDVGWFGEVHTYSGRILRLSMSCYLLVGPY